MSAGSRLKQRQEDSWRGGRGPGSCGGAFLQGGQLLETNELQLGNGAGGLVSS